MQGKCLTLLYYHSGTIFVLLICLLKTSLRFISCNFYPCVTSVCFIDHFKSLTLWVSTVGTNPTVLSPYAWLCVKGFLLVVLGHPMHFHGSNQGHLCMHSKHLNFLALSINSTLDLLHQLVNGMRYISFFFSISFLDVTIQFSQCHLLNTFLFSLHVPRSSCSVCT